MNAGSWKDDNRECRTGIRNKRRFLIMYANETIKGKIREMYPEIGEHGLAMEVDFNEQKQAYIVSFTRGKEALTTHLDKKDADECMDGIKCVHLGVQVAQFIGNFEEREVFGRKAA
jgi:hypothetical protein